MCGTGRGKPVRNWYITSFEQKALVGMQLLLAFCTLGLAHIDRSRVTRRELFVVMFRVRHWAPRKEPKTEDTTPTPWHCSLLSKISRAPRPLYRRKPLAFSPSRMSGLRHSRRKRGVYAPSRAGRPSGEHAKTGAEGPRLGRPNTYFHAGSRGHRVQRRDPRSHHPIGVRSRSYVGGLETTRAQPH